MTQRREEPARDIGGVIQHLLNHLPTPVAEAIIGDVGPWDLSASNVRSYADGPG
jgi:hypothetical protein